MEHQAFPADLLQDIYRYLDLHNADERKAGETDAQFYYKTRKKAMGAFKPELWGMNKETKAALFMAMEEKFRFFYEKLNVTNTRKLIDELVTPVEHHKALPKEARAAGEDLGLAD